ncbi:MAG: TraR/DksA C4-type zinc finger protein [Candidatus Andersenbacteria bacterium]
MDKALAEQMQQQLEAEQKELRAKLGRIASKDPKTKGDFDAKFPQYTDKDETESGDFDNSAHEVQDYADNIGIENQLEVRLKQVDEALARIKNGTYGTCSNCKKQISKERLDADPAVDTCLDCAGTQK